MLANFDLVERQVEPPYADTQLLVLVLGVLVFTHEKEPDAPAAILDGHEGVTDAVQVIYPPAVGGGMAS